MTDDSTVQFDSDDEDVQKADEQRDDDDLKPRPFTNVFDELRKEMLEKEMDSLPEDMKQKMIRIDQIRILIQTKDAEMQRIQKEMESLLDELSMVEKSLWQKDDDSSDTSDIVTALASGQGSSEMSIRENSLSSSFHTFVPKQ